MSATPTPYTGPTKVAAGAFDAAREPAKSDNSDFDAWWNAEGSGLLPRSFDDMESHTRRVAEIAWANGAYKAQFPTQPATET